MFDSIITYITSLQFTASNISNSANCNHNLLAEYCKGPFKIENILHLAFLGDHTSLNTYGTFRWDALLQKGIKEFICPFKNLKFLPYL